MSSPAAALSIAGHDLATLRQWIQASSIPAALAQRARILLLAAHGVSNTEIAERLVVSAHTVQQHLKSVFDKTGVRSRRDLVGKVFFAHYEPRLRDNEHRATTDQPLRGGPYVRSAAT